MKLLGTLCMLLLFLLTGSRQAGEAEKNSALCCQAAMTLQNKQDGHPVVSEYLYEEEAQQKLMYRRILYVSVLGLLLVLLLVLLYVRQRQKVRIIKLAQAASEKEHQFLALQKETEQRLTRKYIDGLESERERIAEDLHDDVCNNLLAFEMSMRSLFEESNASMIDEQLDRLKEVREHLRNISHELMPPVFQYATIDEMLADYILHIALPGQEARIEYHSTGGVDWKQVPQEIGFEYYRIVQETVGNAIRHAEATCICVDLSLEGKRLSLLVTDDGKGFVPDRKSRGVGLRTIQQRAEIIGGKIKLDTMPGAGVRIEISVYI